MRVPLLLFVVSSESQQEKLTLFTLLFGIVQRIKGRQNSIICVGFETF